MVQSYRVQCPPGMAPATWDQAVGFVHTAWVNVVFSPGSVDDDDLDDILARMRTMVSRATPAEAEGDLYRILDLLAHARTKGFVTYLSQMRDWVKGAMPGQGVPSPGLASYALSLVRSEAGETPVATLIIGLQAGDWQVRIACCRALGQYGLGLGSPAEADAALDGLINALDDDEPLVREIAVERLREMGPKAIRAADAVIDRLGHDPSIRVRWQAARTLTEIARGKPAVIPALIAAIDDENPVVGETALSSLADLGKEAEGALPAIRKALQNRAESIRRAAASAIGQVGPPAAVAVPALLDVLENDPSESVRREAVNALAGLGPDATASVPTLIRSLERDDDPNVRRCAALALARIAPTDPRTTTPLIRTMKRDGRSYVRAAAIEALGQNGPPAEAALSDLTEALKDPDFQVRTAAEEALKKMRARP